SPQPTSSFHPLHRLTGPTHREHSRDSCHEPVPVSDLKLHASAVRLEQPPPANAAPVGGANVAVDPGATPLPLGCAGRRYDPPSTPIIKPTGVFAATWRDQRVASVDRFFASLKVWKSALRKENDLKRWAGFRASRRV